MHKRDGRTVKAEGRMKKYLHGMFTRGIGRAVALLLMLSLTTTEVYAGNDYCSCSTPRSECNCNSQNTGKSQSTKPGGGSIITCAKECGGHTFSGQYSWVVVEPTCEKPGTRRIQCDTCTYTKDVDIPKLGHDWGPKQTVSDSYQSYGKGGHTHVVITNRRCKRSGCGAYEDPEISQDNETHSFGEWSVSGSKRTHTCTKCGYSESETVAGSPTPGPTPKPTPRPTYAPSYPTQGPSYPTPAPSTPTPRPATPTPKPAPTPTPADTIPSGMFRCEIYVRRSKGYPPHLPYLPLCLLRIPPACIPFRVLSTCRISSIELECGIRL